MPLMAVADLERDRIVLHPASWPRRAGQRRTLANGGSGHSRPAQSLPGHRRIAAVEDRFDD
jgi:hypothetical protein